MAKINLKPDSAVQRNVLVGMNRITCICEKAEGSEQTAKQTRRIFIIKLEFPESPVFGRSYFIFPYTEPTEPTKSGLSKPWFELSIFALLVFASLNITFVGGVIGNQQINCVIIV